MAKARSIGGIYASLSLRDGGFKKGLKSSAKELKEFGVKAVKGAAVAVAALGAGMAAAAVVGTKSTLTMVDDLADVSTQTGVAVADMMRLQQAYKDGGREASAVGKDIGKMQKAIVAASEGGKDPFAELGLSAANLMAMNPAQQFQVIGDAIMRIENPAKRTAKAMEIFGKGGMGLTTVFGGVDDAVRSLGKMPEIAAQFAGAMGEANDLLGRLPVKSQQFFTGFTAGIIGELLPQLEKIDAYDFTDLGLSVGSAIATGFQGLTDGTIFTIISEKFYASFAKAIGSIENLLIVALTGAYKNTPFGMAVSLAKGESIGYDPRNAFEDAAKMVNPYADFAKELNSEADMLWNDLASRMQQNRESAAARTGGAPVSEPIAVGNLQKFYETKPTAAPLETQAVVNDYQRRGLSLGNESNAAAKKMDEQIEIARESKDYLKNILAKQSNRLTW